MAIALPDPAWTEHPDYCLSCGYSLRGLSPPGACPECALDFDTSVLILVGVPMSRGGPSWRRWAWTALAIAAFIYGNLLILLMFRWGWELTLTLGAAIIIGLVGMLMTSPRERRGHERFVLSTQGVARLPISVERKEDEVDSVFVHWNGANEVEVKRHGAFWRRLRIGHRQGPGHSAFTVMFDAGVRCPDADEARVLATIRGYLASSRARPSA